MTSLLHTCSLSVGTSLPLLCFASLLSFLSGVGVGANDLSANFAMVVGSGALDMRSAIWFCVVFELLGAAIMGGHVSNTIRRGIVNPALFDGNRDLAVLGMTCASFSAAMWLYLSSAFGLPVSITHTVVGSLMGYAFITSGFRYIYWRGIIVIVISWVAAPVLAFICTAGLFLALQKYVLRVRKASLQRTVRALPFCLGVSLLVDFCFLLIERPPLMTVTIAAYVPLAVQYFMLLLVIFSFCWLMHRFEVPRLVKEAKSISTFVWESDVLRSVPCMVVPPEASMEMMVGEEGIEGVTTNTKHPNSTMPLSMLSSAGSAEGVRVGGAFYQTNGSFSRRGVGGDGCGDRRDEELSVSFRLPFSFSLQQITSSPGVGASSLQRAGSPKSRSFGSAGQLSRQGGEQEDTVRLASTYSEVSPPRNSLQLSALVPLSQLYTSQTAPGYRSSLVRYEPASPSQSLRDGSRSPQSWGSRGGREVAHRFPVKPRGILESPSGVSLLSEEAGANVGSYGAAPGEGSVGSWSSLSHQRSWKVRKTNRWGRGEGGEAGSAGPPAYESSTSESEGLEGWREGSAERPPQRVPMGRGSGDRASLSMVEASVTYNQSTGIAKLPAHAGHEAIHVDGDNDDNISSEEESWELDHRVAPILFGSVIVQPFNPRAEYLFTGLQVVAGSMSSFVHGAVAGANATAAFVIGYDAFAEEVLGEPNLTFRWSVAPAMFGLAIGAFALGSRLMKTVGVELVTLTPGRGWVIQVGATLVTMVLTGIGIPVSLSQSQIGAAVGCGVIDGGRGGVSWMLVLKIAGGWVITLLVSAASTAIVFVFASFFVC